MTEHTPTPWREWNVMAEAGKDEYPEPHAGDVRLLGSNNICIGVAFGGYASLPECGANAAFIVKAVNSHDALVEALERAKEFADDEFSNANDLNKKARFSMLCDQIDTALAGVVSSPSGSGK